MERAVESYLRSTANPGGVRTNKLIVTLLVAGMAGGAWAAENALSTKSALALASIASTDAVVSDVLDESAYRRASLSHIDGLALQRDPRAQSGGVWVPGPQAMRLSSQGMDMPDALSAARAAGEFPRFMSDDRVRALRAVEAGAGRDGVTAARSGLAAGSGEFETRAQGAPAR